MSTRFGENLVTDFDTITLLAGQNLIVPVGYQITSINTFAVYGTGTHRMSIGGSLSGGSAAIRIDNGANTRVTVTATGLLMGDLAGVEIYDTASTVVNSGTISSLSGSGILLDNPTPIISAKSAQVAALPAGKFIVRNFGTITGETGITTGIGSATITNEGLIATTDQFAIQSGGLEDTVLNLGRIRGDVALGGGNDTLTNESTIFGDVDLGANDDTFLNTATVRGTVRGGEGNDTIEHEAGVISAVDLGNGRNSLINGARITGTVSGGTGDDAVTNIGGRIDRIDLGGGSNAILNNGGRIGSIVLGDGGNSVTNLGRIDSTVLMGAGFDIFDNFGAIGPNALTISMGGGTNIFMPGAVIELVTSGTGSNDTLDFSRTDGIVVALDGSRPNTGVAKGDSYGGFERIVGSLTGANTLIGNAANNQLEGGAAADLLQGKDGADRLNGNAGNDNLSGGNGEDILDGGDGDDRLVGGADRDTMSGGNGADTLLGEGGDDTISGGAGDDDISGDDNNDTLNGDEGNDTMLGGAGIDTINGGTGDDFIEGNTDNDTLNGDAGNDRLSGGAGNDTVNGGIGDDVVNGDGGDDILSGGVGNDILTGGAGDDTNAGGTGADVFKFLTLDFKDAITDFSRAQADKIDLADFDANSSVAGDQAFTFIGKAAFSGVAGQLRFVTVSGTTAISGDTDGDGDADFTISLTNGASLIATDFVL